MRGRSFAHAIICPSMIIRRSLTEDMASFESKLDAFLEIYEKLKSVENEEAFLKEFIVRECSPSLVRCVFCVAVSASLNAGDEVLRRVYVPSTCQ